MTMHFRYHLTRAKQAVATLGGRWVHPQPLLHVSVVGPSDTYVVHGLLDTGSDEVVFPADLAAWIGVDLTNAPSGVSSGATMAPVPLRYAEVEMRIAGNGERRAWRALVGFTAGPLRRPLLGFAGFMQFFTASFRGDREEFELTVNGLYPGT